MTNKQLQDKLRQYPDDAIVELRIISADTEYDLDDIKVEKPTRYEYDSSAQARVLRFKEIIYLIGH